MLGTGSNRATAEGSAAPTSAWGDDGDTAGDADSEQPDIVELRPEEQVRSLKQQQVAGRTCFTLSRALKSYLRHGMSCTR